MEAKTAIVVALAAILAGCALGRARRAAPAQDREQAALYWADLGPETVDVSSYPPELRRDYETYAAVCSRCHTLARSINAPTASRGYWQMYMLGMRMISAADKDAPISQEQQKAILDFLEYDAQKRKVERSAEFRAQTDELKRRFEPLLRRRMKRLQESGQPALLSR